MKTLIWQGILYQSLEYFKIQEHENHYTTTSKIIGRYEDKIYTVEYQLILDKAWTVSEFLIESEINAVKHRLAGRKQQNEWAINNTITPDCKDFKFIDISLTPFTNTLPINHLKLAENHPQEIGVIYIDVLNHQIRPARQQYTRTTDNTYLYENIQTGFKADISVDEHGFVISYPDLFEKIAELQ